MIRRYFLRTSILLSILLILLAAVPSFGQAVHPDSAQTILKAALSKARDSNRHVLIMFHASWCTWCKRLEAAFNDTSIHPIIENNYVVTMIDVKERGDKIQTDENPGGAGILSKYGGEKSGLPFMVFLNGKGKMIANSNVMPNKENFGYPGAQAEITAFIKILKITAPHITSDQLNAVNKYFTEHAPKQ